MGYSREEVRRANQELHAALAHRYKETEPHYKPENVQRVREILVSLQKRTRGTSLLDLGCGAGFVIDIANGLFDVIRGVDICEPMLSRIDASCRESDIQISLAPTDDTPFDDNTFDVCTAYAVLHHLDAVEPTFREAHRVLRPGGVLYTDLDPNACFWEALRQLPPNGTYSAVVRREIDAVLHKDDELLERFGIAPQLLHAAEHLKHDQGGFREEKLRAALGSAGFRKIEVHYEWFLGEARVIHGHSADAARAVRDHLQALLPLSRHLFKYLIVLAEK